MDDLLTSVPAGKFRVIGFDGDQPVLVADVAEHSEAERLAEAAVTENGCDSDLICPGAGKAIPDREPLPKKYRI
jgi:hypothetical protein